MIARDPRLRRDRSGNPKPYRWFTRMNADQKRAFTATGATESRAKPTTEARRHGENRMILWSGGSREAAAEPILHPRVESSRGFQSVKGRGFQDGVFFGERACTDTLGLQ